MLEGALIIVGCFLGMLVCAAIAGRAISRGREAWIELDHAIQGLLEATIYPPLDRAEAFLESHGFRPCCWRWWWPWHQCKKKEKA